MLKYLAPIAFLAISLSTSVAADIPRMEIPDMLDAHAVIRAQQKLPPLNWSPQLESYAQEWADYLASQSCPLQHRPLSGKFKQLYGENLYWAGAVTWTDGRTELQKTSAKDVVNSWASESNFYNHKTQQCSPGKVCGHYTQIIWPSTTEIGCALSICPNKEQVWVCNYNPAGNIIN